MLCQLAVCSELHKSWTGLCSRNLSVLILTSLWTLFFFFQICCSMINLLLPLAIYFIYKRKFCVWQPKNTFCHPHTSTFLSFPRTLLALSVHRKSAFATLWPPKATLTICNLAASWAGQLIWNSSKLAKKHPPPRHRLLSTQPAVTGPSCTWHNNCLDSSSQCYWFQSPVRLNYACWSHPGYTMVIRDHYYVVTIPNICYISFGLQKLNPDSNFHRTPSY